MEQLSTLKTFYNGLHHHFYHQDGHLNISRLESINNDIANAIFPATTPLPDHIWSPWSEELNIRTLAMPFLYLLKKYWLGRNFFHYDHRNHAGFKLCALIVKLTEWLMGWRDFLLKIKQLHRFSYSIGTTGQTLILWALLSPFLA